MILNSICYDDLSGEERWCVAWSYWAPKPGQVTAALALLCVRLVLHWFWWCLL